MMVIEEVVKDYKKEGNESNRSNTSLLDHQLLTPGTAKTIYIWNFIMGESILSSDSTVDILYFGQSIQVLNTYFHFGKFISFEHVA